MATPWWNILTVWEWAALGPLLLGAALLIAWLIGDRSRGRKRCPKCWYDMGGAVLTTRSEGDTSALCTCPECGRAVKASRELLRTHRSAMKGRIGAVLLILVYAVLATPRVVSDGWKGAIPNTALIAGIWLSPRQPEEMETVKGVSGMEWETRKRNGLIDYSCDILSARMKAGEVWSWQKELAARLAIRRVDRQLDQWPPEHDHGLSNVIETAIGVAWAEDSDRTAHLVALNLEFPKTVVVGCPVPVIVDSVGFGREDIVAEITADWPGAKPVIIQQKSPTGGLIYDLAVTRAQYFRNGEVLDAPSEPRDSVRLTMRLRRSSGSRSMPIGGAEPALRTRVYTVPIKVLAQDRAPLGRIGFVLTPDETRRWRAEIVRSYHASDEISINIEDQSERHFWDKVLPDGIGFGVRAELLKDGVVQGSTLCAFSGNTAYPHCTPMTWMGRIARIRIVPTQPHTADSVLASLDRWSIRLVGDECAARQDPEATSYMVGEVTLPLKAP